jgi:hypothetical protein
METWFSKWVIRAHYVLLHVFIIVPVIVGALAFDKPDDNTWFLGAIVGLVVGVIITGVMFVQLQIAENTIRVRNSLRRIVTLLEEKTDQKGRVQIVLQKSGNEISAMACRVIDEITLVERSTPWPRRTLTRRSVR